MDSQASDDVAHVERKETWADVLLTSVRSGARHVSDDDIFEILHTDRDGEAAAELFAAKGVTVPMYCLWKAKYRRLSREELGEARRRESMRARVAAGVLVAAMVVTAGALVFAITRAAQSGPPIAAAVVSEPPPAAAPVPPPTAAPTASPVLPGKAVEKKVAVSPPVTETGYRIQIAAAQTMHEGRVLVDRLAAAGYPAYLLSATVRDADVFRVRVGPFDTLESAEDVAARLRREGYAGAWIAR